MTELAAIYEPAFEAAGEWPAGVTYEHGMYFREGTGDDMPMFRDDAANACRCWAEDFINGYGRAGFVMHVPPCVHGTGAHVVALVGVEDCRLAKQSSYAGPTIHHALAAAVIAVAKAKPQVGSSRLIVPDYPPTIKAGDTVIQGPCPVCGRTCPGCGHQQATTFAPPPA